MSDFDRGTQGIYQEKRRLKEKVAFRRTVRKKLKSVVIWIVVVLTILFTAGGILVSFQRGTSDKVDAGKLIAPYIQRFEEQGREHISDTQHFEDYNSNPPTSGPHHAVAARWGVYEKELPEGQLIHNLEHCGIWVSYKPDIASELKAKLTAFAKGYPTKLIMAPRAKNIAPIVMAAWRVLMPLQEFDEVKMNAFAVSFLNKAGPECNAL